MRSAISSVYGKNEDIILGLVHVLNFIPPDYTYYPSHDAFGERENDYFLYTSIWKSEQCTTILGDFNARTAEVKDYRQTLATVSIERLISMGTNWTHLIADIFLCSYETELIVSTINGTETACRFTKYITYRYIDDGLSINNPYFENRPGQMYMYPLELEIKDTTYSNTSASHLGLLLSFGMASQIHTSIYDKRDHFNFHITNLPILSSYLPSSTAHGFLIPQLITIYSGLLLDLIWMLYFESQMNFQYNKNWISYASRDTKCTTVLRPWY